jgi:hypothetical protein
MDAHAPETEYRSSMQAAALAFLQLHRAEHLGDDEQLADRAVSYLVRAMEVPLFLAPRLVELAMSELLRPDWVGIDPGSNDQADICLIDIRSGQRLLVHRRILPTAFLARFITR